MKKTLRDGDCVKVRENVSETYGVVFGIITLHFGNYYFNKNYVSALT